MNEKIDIQGTIFFYKGKKSSLIGIQKNKILDKAKSDILDLYLGNQTTPVGVNYVAMGDGENIDGVGLNDTGLENELFRKQISNIYKVGQNRLVVEIYLEPNEANGFTWREIGMFANGTTGIGSGVLYHKAKISDPNIKNSSTGTTISWEVVI